MMEEFSSLVTAVSAEGLWRQGLIIVVAILLAVLVRLLFSSIVRPLTRKTTTDLDDRLVRALRGPIAYTFIFAAVAVVIADAPIDGLARYVSRGVIITAFTLMWSVALMRTGSAILDFTSHHVDRIRWLEPKTLPLFEILLKVLVVGGFLYFVCIAWMIPVASWLASAGIIGIAVGFAAKDTLANLFSGVFIIADAPYRVGDFVILDNTVRGVVTEIGIRSTRLLTRDDIEVTVPNAVIGNALIVNETGGPHDKMRVRVKVSAAYGSDVGQVRETLLGVVDGVPHVVAAPAPRVRFREFGDSGLLFELMAWIEEPVFRGRVLDELNTRVYKAFAAAGIEIPYAKYDVYIKEHLTA